METQMGLNEYERLARIREERRDARRQHQQQVRRERNRRRLEAAGQPIPPELQEPGEKMRRPADIGFEDKMLRREDVPAEDKGVEEEAEETVEQVGSGEQPDDADPLEGVQFASAKAEELARAEGLGYDDFGFEPSGKTGYTKADVEELLEG